MSDFAQVAQDYIDVWNENDANKRVRLADRVFTPDVVYTDPLIDVAGIETLLAAITGVQQQFPGFVFRLHSADGHHQQLRFGWELGPGGADAPIAGFDVATVDADGRIRQVLGFLDRVPN